MSVIPESVLNALPAGFSIEEKNGVITIQSTEVDKRIIEEALKVVSKHPRVQPTTDSPFRPVVVQGRNEICKCGSGKKFKKCCK